jgi:hypothetical protein
MTMSSSQSQSQRISQTIHGDMHFGGETTTTTPQRLSGLPATFFGLQQHMDAHERWCCRSCYSPYRGHRRSAAAYVPLHLDHTSEDSVCRLCSISRIRRVTTAIGRHSGLSKGLLPRNDDIQPRFCRHRRMVRFSGNPGFSTIVDLKDLY